MLCQVPCEPDLSR